MYTSFYKLHSKPFQISSDPEFLWFGEKHKEALATLRYGILDNKGFLLLTGDVGTGKTSLINALLQNLGKDIVSVSVPDPSLEKMDFFNYIAGAFDFGKEFSTKGTFLAHFRQFLLETNENQKKVLLIIDEAQLLTQEMLEEIRLLSNIEKTDSKLINIFFVGQNEFNEILNKTQNRAVRQRLTLNYNLDPLTPDETGEYIQHRLKVAGTTDPIFDPSAVQEVFMYSGGFPRRINIICDHCLLSGFVRDEKTINAQIVRECAKELKIPAHVRNRDINGFQSFAPAAPIKPRPPLSEAPEVKKRSRFFLWTAALALACILSWFISFPDHFKNSLTTAGQRLMVFKNQILAQTPHQVPDAPQQKFQPLGPSPGQVPETSPSGPVGIEKSSEIVTKPIPNDTPKPIEALNPDLTLKPEQIQPSRPMEQSTLQTDPGPAVHPDPMEPLPVKILMPPPAIPAEIEELPTDRKKLEIHPEIPPLPREKVLVRFDYNTNDFTEIGFENLKTFANILALHPEANILVSGYTDSEGHDTYNQKLSEFRANIVKSFLLGRGATLNQIKIKGMGSKNPIETNATAWGRNMNRRVEIEVVD